MPETEWFYDFIFYNADTYELPEKPSVLAEIYFRLDVDMVTH